MEESNLIVLRYSVDTGRTESFPLAEFRDEPTAKKAYPHLYDDFNVDIAKGAWTFRGGTFSIGRGFSGRRANYDIIGVYDKTNAEHLQAMLACSYEARHPRDVLRESELLKLIGN